MSTVSLSSLLSGTDSLSLQLAKLKSASQSALLDSLDESSSSSSLAETIYTGLTDCCQLSAISSSLKTIASAAEKSGVADAMNNVRLFAATLQNEGIDTASILKYLNIAKGLAQNDPETFAEIFSGKSGTASNTIAAMAADDSQETTS
ncbi:MAG TPA: hypothetical protein P5244_10245 [Syntrophales bacterium]|nr:hypothetical protein [Syntrophales bacterium]